MSGMSIVGALAPPPGVTPNFEHPQGSIKKYNVVAYALGVPVITIFVAVRLYVKAYIIRAIHPEDYMIIAAWLFALGYSAIGLATLSFGAGDHQWDVPLTNISTYSKIAFANELWYSPTIYTTKVSILLLYLRLFRPARALVWSSRILIVLLLFYFVSDLALVFLCNPIRKHWDIETPGHCGNLYLLFIVNGVFSIITDFWILLSPMPVIWHLQMPVKRKIAVTAVFAAGLLGCIANVLRTSYTGEAVAIGGDTTYIANLVNLWSVPEVFIGIVCVCLPITPAFYQHFRRKQKDHTNFTQTGSVPHTVRSTATKGLELDQTILIPVIDRPNFENTIEGGFHMNESQDFHLRDGLEGEGIIRTVEVRQW